MRLLFTFGDENSVPLGSRRVCFEICYPLGEEPIEITKLLSTPAALGERKAGAGPILLPVADEQPLVVLGMNNEIGRACQIGIAEQPIDARRLLLPLDGDEVELERRPRRRGAARRVASPTMTATP